MPQAFSSVFIHIVFSTKNRVPFLTDVEFRERTHSYLAGVAKGHDCLPIAVGGVEDHVHILVQLGRTISQADLVKKIKRASSLWVEEQNAGLQDFYWQSGYGVFGVAEEDLPSVTKYVRNQAEHHRSLSFKEEFLALLVEHKMSWDERYMWD